MLYLVVEKNNEFSHHLTSSLLDGLCNCQLTEWPSTLCLNVVNETELEQQIHSETNQKILTRSSSYLLSGCKKQAFETFLKHRGFAYRLTNLWDPDAFAQANIVTLRTSCFVPNTFFSFGVANVLVGSSQYCKPNSSALYIWSFEYTLAILGKTLCTNFHLLLCQLSSTRHVV